MLMRLSRTVEIILNHLKLCSLFLLEFIYNVLKILKKLRFK